MPFQTDITWTPTTYRAAHAAWRSSAPANDSDILGRSPRMSGSKPLAARLAPLLLWRKWASPEEPVSTNYLAANDNVDPDGMSVHRASAIRPSVDEMMAAVKDVELRDFRHAKLGGGGDPDRTPSNIAFVREVGLKVGGLLFADGETQRERCHLRTEAGIVTGSYLLKRGALRFASEKPGNPLGAGRDADEIKASNAHIADLTGAAPHRFVKAGKRLAKLDAPAPSLPPASMSFAEARAFAGLAPTDRPIQPALPCGSPVAGDSFIGMRTVGKGRTPQEVWRDAEGVHADAEEAERVRSSLSGIDVAVLDMAIVYSSFADIGVALGHAGDNARRAGKKALLAANDNLAKILAA